MHVPGPTGTGKTALLLNVAIADARAGRGLAVSDPKGDLVRDLLDRLPPGMAGRVVITAAGTYAELFTLQANAYTDPPVQPNGHHATGTVPAAQPQRDNVTH